MILGEVRRCFFQKLRLHAQFTVFSLEFLQPGPVADRQRRFLADVVAPIRVHPVTKRPLNNPEFTRNGRPFNVDPILARPMVRDLGISRSQLARAAITSDIIKGKDPSKDVQRAATDVLFHRELDEGNEDPYAVYRGREVSYEVQLADSGKTATVTVDLGEAFDQLDQRDSALRALQECLQ